MRRFLLLILITALLGLATSMGVAWLVAGTQPRWAALSDREDLGGSGWRVVHYKGRGQSIWSAAADWYYEGEAAAGNRGAADLIPLPQPRDAEDWIMEHRVGWPVLSWKAQWRSHPTGMGLVDRNDLHGGALIGWPSTAPSAEPNVARILPFEPLWPTVIADVGFWWAAWCGLAALLLLPAILRHWLRKRSNRCVICGYDQRGRPGQVCSECGASTHARPDLLPSWLPVALGGLLFVAGGAEILLGVEIAGRHHYAFPIHFAARDGDLKAIERALARGVSADILADGAEHPGGTTALMWAAAGDQPEAVRCLIRAGASLEKQDLEGRTPLMIAAARGARESLAALIDGGAELDRVVDGTTALYAAVAARQHSCVRALIDAGADVSAGSYLPIRAAIDFDRAILEMLMDAGADLSNPALVWHAAERRNAGDLRLLLEHGASATARSDGWSLFHSAIYDGSPEIARVLAECGVDPTVRYLNSRTPLELALDSHELFGGYDEYIAILEQAELDWQAMHPN